METKICYNCFATISGDAGACPHCGYDSAADAGKYPLALPHGAILNGRYIVGRALGQGGFGITYVARDVQTGERAAIKEYFPETMATRTGSHNVTAFSGQRQENFAYGMQCFLSEAQTLAQFIGAENIVRVHSYFEENGTGYFVMDYVDGVSFQAYLKQHGGKIRWEEAMGILCPVMEALSLVHSKGIIHRDIAPDNIYITSDGIVKLLDFGAARYSLGDKSRSLDVVLKPGYSPKEQYIRRGRQGPYTDVYSMAATLYFALTGRIPPESVERMDEDELILPSSLGCAIPEYAEMAMEKALAVQPADRFQTMTDFLAAITTEGYDLGAMPESRPQPVQMPVSAPRAYVSQPGAQSQPMSVPQPVPQPVSVPQPQPEQKAKAKLPIPAIAAGAAAAAAVFLGISLVTGGGKAPATAPAATERPVLQETQPTRIPEEQLPVIIEPVEPVAEKLYEKVPQTLSAGRDYVIGIKNDGSVVSAGGNAYGKRDLSGWKNITRVSAGSWHSVGLKADGTVVAVGGDAHGRCDVSSWRDIAAVSAGRDHTVGLKKDGTVVAAGYNEDGRCDVSSWSDIISIAAGESHTVAVKRDGTVVASGDNSDGQCNVSGWTDIVVVAAGARHTVGLKADGSVVSTGWNEYGQCDLYGWTDIISVSADYGHSVGLKKDGTVVTAGRNNYGQCDVGSWKNIAAVHTGLDFTVGLRNDGTVVAVGKNDKQQCAVSMTVSH